MREMCFLCFSPSTHSQKKKGYLCAQLRISQFSTHMCLCLWISRVCRQEVAKPIWIFAQFLFNYLLIQLPYVRRVFVACARRRFGIQVLLDKKTKKKKCLVEAPAPICTIFEGNFNPQAKKSQRLCSIKVDEGKEGEEERFRDLDTSIWDIFFVPKWIHDNFLNYLFFFLALNRH